MKAKTIAPARVLWSSVLLLALAVSALACSSGKKDEAATTTTSSSSTSSAAATTTGSSTSSGTTTAASNSTTSRSTTSSGSSASGSGARLSSLNSYKYDVKMEGFGGPLADFGDAFGGMGGTPAAPGQSVTFQVTGAYIKPDKAQMTIVLPGLSFGQTIIGTQEWVDFGGMKQGPTPTTEKAADLSLAAAFWDEADLADAVTKFSCDSSRSSVNGVQARKCGVDKATYEVLKSQLGGFFDDSEIKDLTRFSLEAWLSDAGIPVRVLIDMAGKDATNANFSLKLTMNLTDINGNFEIKAP